MRVLRSGVNLQLRKLMIAQSGVRQHPANGTFENRFRTARAQSLQTFLFVTTGITGVAAVELLRLFLAGHFDLLGIDDNDEIAAVNVRSELRLVFATENIGDAGGNATKDLPLSVHQMPSSFYFLRLCA